MTQEEKAKAYDEVVKRAKAAIDIAADKDLVGGVVRTILPELTESEDERIREELIEYHKRQFENNRDQEVGLFHKDALAWLEKQKENIEKEYVFRPLTGTDITIVAEQAIRRADEGDRLVLAFNGAYIPVRKGCNANKIVDIYDAFIEKQKEQKVDIDKLRRDLYQSGYNDGYQHGKEDAQKEQKPNIELIQRSWYMEGYNDRKFGNEPKWIIKTGEGGPKHELNPRYGQPLTERQVTEEQLHNLNEAIKSFRMDGFDKIADSLHSLYNILTTQAQKTAEWNANDKAFIKDCARILDENGYAASADRLLSMFEQKPVQDMEEKEYVRTLKSLIADFLYGKDEIDRGYYQKIYDWLDGRHIKQEPEWSEEDNEMLECVIMDVESAKDKYLKSTTEVIRQGAIIADKELAWLKSLRPQYHGDVTMTEAYKMGLEAGKASSWKPSEHQMEALGYAISGDFDKIKPTSYLSRRLEEIEEQLKKLM